MSRRATSGRALAPRSREWREVAAHAARLRSMRIGDLFAAEPQRFARFSTRAAGLLLDFSRHRIDAEALTALLALAARADVPRWIAAMFRGDEINATEQRAVLHVALRQSSGAAIGGAAIEREVLEERARMLRFVTEVRAGRARGAGGEPFTTVVNIGIGGSDLGPAMAVEALLRYATGGPAVRFVSNVDGCALADVLEHADPARTLFIIASKTFTTQETMANARTARAWVADRLGAEALPQHFAAVSVNARAMDEFGVNAAARFRMWDWVGGRYSMWSSIGVSLAMAIGVEAFESLLHGAHAMDLHFRDAPLESNLPVLSALLGVWNINFMRLPTLAVLPYDSRLARFPAFLQQLDMESNGKSVGIDGRRIAWETAPVVWGEPGNNAQHSFFQLLHQGTARAALEFLLSIESSCGSAAQHELALANALAQLEAFALGQDGPELPAHKVHEGQRPASVLLFDRLDPATLGALVASYEHRTFVQSIVWGINAFDQWGVELGKKLAGGVESLLRGAHGAEPSPSLAGLLGEVRARRRALGGS